ncbi:SGNH/GDSL hydrolase family protein [Mucilaginibacter aquatilis]|uniref:SGNH/GDSL hydrolase family protein n=1 Tax=Mucilaginibacter aquatilis TaxID=1517760 RepID=A0A6I4I9X0_9SPHI|nr:SGNH/GDSL hydrolase family protein [Mucilaginibacter aquatilis]MVN90276.1 SGNH/GDSL hydrolase family protein [Mucilaginibacter aquatilis]
MRKINLIILLMIALTGCANKAMNEIEANLGAGLSLPKDGLSYLALGDSYTIGEAVPAEASFPYQLAAGLTKQQIKTAAPTIIARTGWTTDELIAAIKQRSLTQKFDIVTLLIGVNNQYRGYNIDTYRTEFVQLLNTALAYAGGNKRHVFVVSIPDWGVTPFAQGRDRSQIAREIDQYNAINKEETLKAGVSYTDITPGSRNAATDAALVATDGLHPSGKMYSEWVAKLLPEVVKSSPF